MIRYEWNKSNSFIEIKGIRNGLLDNSIISEARIVISQDKSTTKLIWLYVPKSEQKKGYGNDILKEIGDNLLRIVENPELLNVIVFDRVTSLGTLNLIKNVFPCVEIDFSHLPEFIREKRIRDFEAKPWIPELSPAKYLGKNECVIAKNAPGVNLKLNLNKLKNK